MEYEGEVGIGDYPWIPQAINESRMFPIIYDTLVVRSVNRLNRLNIYFCPRQTQKAKHLYCNRDFEEIGGL